MSDERTDETRDRDPHHALNQQPCGRPRPHRMAPTPTSGGRIRWIRPTPTDSRSARSPTCPLGAVAPVSPTPRMTSRRRTSKAPNATSSTTNHSARATQLGLSHAISIIGEGYSNPSQSRAVWASGTAATHRLV